MSLNTSNYYLNGILLIINGQKWQRKQKSGTPDDNRLYIIWNIK